MEIVMKLSRRLNFCWLVLLLLYGLHGYMRQSSMFKCDKSPRSSALRFCDYVRQASTIL